MLSLLNGPDMPLVSLSYVAGDREDARGVEFRICQQEMGQAWAAAFVRPGDARPFRRRYLSSALAWTEFPSDSCRMGFRPEELAGVGLSWH